MYLSKIAMMNKSFYRLTISLVLIIILLVMLFAITSIGFVAIWLNTYKAFTKETLVAEISVSEEKINEKGLEYFEIEYKPIKEESVLGKIINKEDSESEKNKFEQTQEFVAYGDYFEVGGHVIKFQNWVTFLGFDTIYKVTRLEGDFSNVQKADNVEEKSVYELNGGVDSYWKTLERDQGKFDFVVDTVYGSFATKFVQNQERIYGLYITEDGFILDELDQLNYQD